MYEQIVNQTAISFLLAKEGERCNNKKLSAKINVIVHILNRRFRIIFVKTINSKKADNKI